MKILLSLFTSITLLLAAPAQALTSAQAEDLAGLTAIFIYLKNDCGYQDLSNVKIEKAIVLFARSNNWDLGNYDSKTMSKMNKENYLDIKSIRLSSQYKCSSLARESLPLLTYAY